MATAKSPLAANSPTPATLFNRPTSPYDNQATYIDRQSVPSQLENGLVNGYEYPDNYDPSYSSPTSHQQLAQPYVSSPHRSNHPLSEDGDYDQTLSNTLANAHIGHIGASPPHEPNSIAAPFPTRPTGKFTEEWDASQRGSSIIDGPASRTTHTGNMSSIQRSNSFSGSTTGGGLAETASQTTLSRGNTLKKKASLRRSGSLKRSSSRRSAKAGSVRSLALTSNADENEMQSAFFCPVPTTGNPTDALANRFQAWRKILKDLITYFKEIQVHYEHRSKSLLKLANVLNNVQTPGGFLTSGGLDDAVDILRNYNAQAIQEANKARGIEEDVILALTGLRSDLQQKVKEIKNLSGDFKNGVDKEMDATRRAVNTLQGVLGKTELDSALTTGKDDPYLLRLAVDRQLERQIDEENYLHQAYLNLENSGRELESIVVGEIQKSYNAYAGILKRESEAAYDAIDQLRAGPIAMPKDHEWTSFVRVDDQFVDPNLPLRSAQYIHYPGRDHFACQEIRAGLLERKTKYLKSYTAGWYVLSPTHLHEFKSADKTQSPVMSLYLPEQKLGSRSQEGSNSPKFILKGRQTGGVHRGHSWVFRAESFDTMLAWYEDIKALTEKSPQERNEYVIGHARSYSSASQQSRTSISSDAVVNEDDDEPYGAHNSAAAPGQQQQQQNGQLLLQQDAAPRRPSPGGRFPSDIQVNAQRGLQAPLSPSSITNADAGPDEGQPPPSPRPPPPARRDSGGEVIAAAGALPGSGLERYFPAAKRERVAVVAADPYYGYGDTAQAGPMRDAHARAADVSAEARADGVNPYTSQPILSSRDQRSHLPVHYYEGSASANANAAMGAGQQQQAAGGGGADGGGGAQRLSSHEASWLAGGPAEAAAIPVVVGGAAAHGGPGPGPGPGGDAGPRHPIINTSSSLGVVDAAEGSRAVGGPAAGGGGSGGTYYAAGGRSPGVSDDTLEEQLLADSGPPSVVRQSLEDPISRSGSRVVGSGGQANGAAAGVVGGRPGAGGRTESVPTISNLHIPGEYPKPGRTGAKH